MECRLWWLVQVHCMMLFGDTQANYQWCGGKFGTKGTLASPLPSRHSYFPVHCLSLPSFLRSLLLKMICNDFLVVKLNCPSYVFNISKSIWILRNIKKLRNFRISARECAPDDLFTFASDAVIPGKQTREQAIGVLCETLHNTWE